jgi:hypothetical protein
VGADDGGVQDEPLEVFVLEVPEELAPDALARPAVEPPPDGVPVAEAFGQVAPGRAGLGDPQDGVDEQAVVPGGDAGVALLARKQILDAIPILVSYGVPVRHGSLARLDNCSRFHYSPLLVKCPHYLMPVR